MTEDSTTDVYVYDERNNHPLEQYLRDGEIPCDISSYPLGEVLDGLRRVPGVRVRFGTRKSWMTVAEEEVQKKDSILASVPHYAQSNSGPEHWVFIDAPRGGYWKIACGWTEESTGRSFVGPRLQRGTSKARMYDGDALPLVIHAGEADGAGFDWSHVREEPATDSERGSDAAENEPRQRVMQERWERSPTHRREVLREYGDACVVCGWKVTSGDGPNGVEAAHIRPVEAGGKDGPENGLPLCRNHHWMFDEGLITIDSNFQIFTADDERVREAVAEQLDGSSLMFPDGSMRPSRENIKWRIDSGDHS